MMAKTVKVRFYTNAFRSSYSDTTTWGYPDLIVFDVESENQATNMIKSVCFKGLWIQPRNHPIFISPHLIVRADSVCGHEAEMQETTNTLFESEEA